MYNYFPCCSVYVRNMPSWWSPPANVKPAGGLRLLKVPVLLVVSIIALQTVHILKSRARLSKISDFSIVLPPLNFVFTTFLNYYHCFYHPPPCPCTTETAFKSQNSVLMLVVL